MKRAIFAFVVFAMLFAGCSTVSASSHNLNKVSFETLPADSKYAGTYYAEFCNRGVCWPDSGTYKPAELIFSKPTVHTAYLQGDMAHLILSARSDYEWVWDEGGLFSRPGYILKKK